MLYNEPGVTASSVGTQFRTDYIYKKALVEAAKETYFGQLADVRSMPKNMGKTIKQYHYMPILDDRNINDQGLDASGAATTNEVTITVVFADGNIDRLFVGNGADAAAALTAARTAVIVWAEQTVAAGGLGVTITGVDLAADLLVYEAELEALDNITSVTEGSAIQAYGNLYGSSKDIGYITGKIPALSESGGRVNRVGMTRINLEGSIEKFGFFDEYTQETMDFDTDEELEMHLTSESVKAANELTEDQLQIDLLNGAGVVRYTGDATKVSELQGTSTTPDAITYDDFVKLGIELDNNRCPKQTKIITGSRMVDTAVVNAARYVFIGSEMIPSIMKMTDYHSERAFIPVAKYGSAGTIARGEIGAVNDFRIIVVPEMMKWAGVGAAEGTNGGYYATDGNYDVFPLLVIGDKSFTTIGFQTDGKTVKFKIKHMKPEQNYSTTDPYGETGFYSIKWYYGVMILRPERLAIIKTVAEI